MTSAPLSQQRLLIDLQRLDSQLARLTHERKHLPVLERIEATVQQLKLNRRRAVVAAAALDEAQANAKTREEEVDQVVHRAQVLRERLSSGAAPARELTAIQSEIDQLGRRQAVLEEAQIAAMEQLEAARTEVDAAAAEEKEIRAGGRELTAARDADFARLDAEIADARGKRNDLAAAIGDALLAEYEAVRKSTGGLGAVALHGRRVEGGGVEISPQEYARIAAAPQDRVIHAEENDVIVVRMED
ncbi:MAG: hypothetical protein I3J03_01480 [Actinomyces succiniciruminis]|uniref:Zn-ribbon protein protein n=1 Tax=Actinomyces succiniciruminis TaxID=1522002 RepID=A0A1L7RB89_9ACTO|nr:hypothetical protein [Actinomyces succiniciruminis]MBE6475181.1 hypothetical protein [Actinomyces succiniciruminis]MBM6978374.1 hypothetical protein [Actinomyces succiniciruminis]CED91125.1 Zn-ribbon protein protein [Actinomyces succiniciruminis]